MSHELERLADPIAERRYRLDHKDFRADRSANDIVNADLPSCDIKCS